MISGIANLPLHYGSCPPWLFEKMKKLAGAITEIIIYEYSDDEFLKRLSDPFWFQAFACVLGFDWHSSGVTTTVCGAMKEALNKENIGVVVAGGKGKTSRKTPEEIEKFGEALSLSDSKIKNLVYSSKMSAKVDNAALQDGYNLYHHCFIFNEKGRWVVIQQGMNLENRYARRYHWISDKINETKSFVEEPESAICCDKKEEKILNMVAKESKSVRENSVAVVNDIKNFEKFFRDKKFLKELSLPSQHNVTVNKTIVSYLKKAYEVNPENYEELLALRGIGPASVRALALISSLIYGSEPSWKDPVKFSFAHGGKDGHPYPVDRENYEKSIEILTTALENAKIGEKEKLQAMRRLSYFI